MTAATQNQLTEVTRPALSGLFLAAGEIYVGDIFPRDGKPGYHLILVTDERAKVRGAFGQYGQDIEGATDIRDGHANTQALIAAGSPIALQVKALNDSGIVNGRTDLYLAAPLEMSLCNLNAGEHLSHDEWYYSSAQYSSSFAWVQDFEDGTQTGAGKNDERPALVVRRSIIQ